MTFGLLGPRRRHACDTSCCATLLREAGLNRTLLADFRGRPNLAWVRTETESGQICSALDHIWVDFSQLLLISADLGRFDQIWPIGPSLAADLSQIRADFEQNRADMDQNWPFDQLWADFDRIWCVLAQMRRASTKFARFRRIRSKSSHCGRSRTNLGRCRLHPSLDRRRTMSGR